MTQPVKLASGALGKAESIIMGVAGAAPAFTISVAAAGLVGEVGALSVFTIILCGVIVFGIALAFQHLNGVARNAGASYALVGHVFGPVAGFVAGWAALTAFALAMVSAAVPAATATLLVIAPERAEDTLFVLGVGAFWFTLVSAVALRGIKPASVVQIGFVLVEALALLLIAAGVLVHISTAAVRLPDWSWVDLGAVSPVQLATGVLIAVYFYWGWDVTINLSEETGDEDGKTAGAGAFWSVLNLMLLYIILVAMILLTMTDSEASGADTQILFVVAGKLFPAPWSYIAVLAVMLSTVGTLETQILQFTRSLFAMARDGHFHPRYARLHDSWRTPHVATVAVWVLGMAFLLASSTLPTVSAILDSSIAALGLQICTYMGLTGFACAWHFRADLRSAAWPALSRVVWPLASAAVMVVVMLWSLPDLGLTTTLIGFGGLAVGVIPFAMARQRMRSSAG